MQDIDISHPSNEVPGKQKQSETPVSDRAAHPKSEERKSVADIENKQQVAGERSAEASLDSLLSLGQGELGAVRTILAAAQLPDMDQFTYSEELHDDLIMYAKDVKDLYERYDNETDEKKRQERLKSVVKTVKFAADKLFQQFILDNTTGQARKDAQKQNILRLRKDPHELNSLIAHVGAMKAITEGDEERALEIEEHYVKDNVFDRWHSVGWRNYPSYSEARSLMRAVAQTRLSFAKNFLLPALNKKIEEFAAMGYWKTLWWRTKQTGGFVRDWVSVPFSEEAKQRMADSFVPVIELGAKGMEKLLPALKDLAAIAYNVSLSKGQLCALAKTLAGSLTFDVATCALSMGVGPAMKGVQAPAGVTAGVATLTKATEAGKAAIGIPHFFADVLSAEKMDKYVQKEKGANGSTVQSALAKQKHKTDASTLAFAR